MDKMRKYIDIINEQEQFNNTQELVDLLTNPNRYGELMDKYGLRSDIHKPMTRTDYDNFKGAPESTLKKDGWLDDIISLFVTENNIERSQLDEGFWQSIAQGFKQYGKRSTDEWNDVDNWDNSSLGSHLDDIDPIDGPYTNSDDIVDQLKGMSGHGDGKLVYGKGVNNLSKDHSTVKSTTKNKPKKDTTSTSSYPNSYTPRPKFKPINAKDLDDYMSQVRDEYAKSLKKK
jgi:hypothetical protein